MSDLFSLASPEPSKGIPTISSLQIAEITGKNHADVMRDIRSTLEQAEIGLSKFASSYRNSQNKEQPCYNLPRRECDLVISGYSVKYRLAIIDRWQELEAKQTFQIPQTLPDALRLAAQALEENQRLQIVVAEQKPKVEFHDRVTESETACQMAVAAQVAKLPFGRNTLFQKLRQRGMLISGGERHNLPKQEYVARGLFTVTEYPYENQATGETKVSFTTGVTQKGIAWLIKEYGKREEAA